MRLAASAKGSRPGCKRLCKCGVERAAQPSSASHATWGGQRRKEQGAVGAGGGEAKIAFSNAWNSGGHGTLRCHDEDLLD